MGLGLNSPRMKEMNAKTEGQIENQSGSRGAQDFCDVIPEKQKKEILPFIFSDFGEFQKSYKNDNEEDIQ